MNKAENMGTEFENLPYMLTPDDSEIINDAFPEKIKKFSVPAGSEDRILRSVMRKAGYEMNEPINNKRTIKKLSRPVIFAVAAAVILTAAISAAAYGLRKSKEENIEDYLGTEAVRILADNNIDNAQSAENPHFRIYLDTLISDGNYAEMVFACEALDDEADQYLVNDGYSWCFPEPVFCYADTGDPIPTSGSQMQARLMNDDDPYMYYTYKLPLYFIDKTREIKISFDTIYDKEFNEMDHNLADDTEMTVNFSPNVKRKIFVDENGTEFVLSPLGFSTFAPMDKLEYLLNEKRTYEYVALIGSDGTEYPKDRLGFGLCFPSSPELEKEYLDQFGINGPYDIGQYQISFGDLFDVENYIGIKIDDNYIMEKTE